MRVYASVFVGLCLSGCVFAQERNVPERARDEIERRGDYIERIEGNEPVIGQSLSPPKDDSHKWFFTLITTPGCAQCELLKAHLQSKRELLAFVNPDDKDKSWMHYNVFRSDDETQKWRWQKVRIIGYPTVIIQPPLNGQYGKPSTVVLQITGYDGDARKLARQLRDGILRYVDKLTEKIRGGALPAEERLGPPERDVGQRPPFDLPQPDPQPSPVVPVVPGPVTPDDVHMVDLGDIVLMLLRGIIEGRGTANTILIAAVIIGALWIMRQYRKTKGMKLLLTDQEFDRLVEAIKKAVQNGKSS